MSLVRGVHVVLRDFLNMENDLIPEIQRTVIAAFANLRILEGQLD